MRALAIAVVLSSVGCTETARVALRTGALYPLLAPFSSCRVSQGAYTPERGHVVAITLDGVRTVRRIAGIAGDKVSVIRGALHIGSKTRQTEVQRARVMCLAGVYPRCRCRITQERVGSRTYPVQTLRADTGPGVDVRCVPRPDTPEQSVPKGHVFLLADNRDAAQDSRSLGAVPISKLEGQVLGCKPAPRPTVPPLSPEALKKIERELAP